MRFRLLVSEAWRSLGANLSTTFAAMMTVLVGMFLLGLFIALGTWTLSWSNHVKRELRRQGRLQDDADKGGRRRARRRTPSRACCSRTRRSSTWTFVSKEQALEQMKKRYPELDADLPYNPLPDSFEVTPTKAEYLDDARASLRPAAARRGDDRSTGKQLSSRVLQVAHVIEVDLHDRDRRAADRRDAADREHDPALDLLAPP